MMNKNTVLAWATFIMILVGLGLIALGAFKYDDVAGWDADRLRRTGTSPRTASESSCAVLAQQA